MRERRVHACGWGRGWGSGGLERGCVRRRDEAQQACRVQISACAGVRPVACLLTNPNRPPAGSRQHMPSTCPPHALCILCSFRWVSLTCVDACRDGAKVQRTAHLGGRRGRLPAVAQHAAITALELRGSKGAAQRGRLRVGRGRRTFKAASLAPKCSAAGSSQQC